MLFLASTVGGLDSVFHNCKLNVFGVRTIGTTKKAFKSTFSLMICDDNKESALDFSCTDQINLAHFQF